MKIVVEMRQETIQKIDSEKVIAIVRGANAEQAMKVADALYAGGIRLLELTFNMKQPELNPMTASAIKAIGEKYEGKMLVGAGTVTSTELVEMAFASGAKFIISPDVNEQVIRRTVELGMVSMPGALTPTEAMDAHEAGADYVKLFPAGDLGCSYIKSVRAPLSHIKFTAVGGVNENNAADFMKAGVVGLGVGGNLANKQWIENGEYYKITETAKKLVEAVKSF